MSVLSCRNLNLLTVLAAASILAACATTNTGTEEGLSSETESSAQAESEPAAVSEPQADEAETLQIETISEIEATAEPYDTEPASESVSDEIAQTQAVDEAVVFPEQQYELEEPLELEIESETDAEIDRLREELAASEAELARSRAAEAEAERSRELEAELERSRAIEAELESSLALESEAETSRALEAEQVRSRELEAELERSRARQAELDRERLLEEELERDRQLEAEAERDRALEAELERSRQMEADADTGFDSEYAGTAFPDSSETDSGFDEFDNSVPDYTTIAQADPDMGDDESITLPPGKPVEYSVYFGYNQAVLELEFETTLMAHAEYLKANPELTVEIQGNCDERGSREYNIALGGRRAQTIKRALELLGIDGGRIATVSFGAEKPIAFGHDEESWRLNRRADIVY